MAEMHMRDSMTGMYNRRGFYNKAPEFIQKYNGKGEYVLISADLDMLKMINDTYGHDMGDKAIKSAADILCEVGGDKSVCARFGGDEFVLLTVTENADSYISEFESRLNKILDGVNAESGYPFELSVSCGCAKLENSYFQRIDDIIKIADVQMYENKRRRHRERK
jgi:diguanylate cyclase (GGDEF)-like protein